MSAQFEENSVLKFMKDWEHIIKNQPTIVETDEDIPEDIREDVINIRQNFADTGIDTESIYLTDMDIGGPRLSCTKC